MARFLPIDFYRHADSTLANLPRQLIDTHSVVFKTLADALTVCKITGRRAGQGEINKLRDKIPEQFSRILFPEGNHKIADVLFYIFAVQ